MDLNYFLTHKFDYKQYPVRMQYTEGDATVDLARTYGSINIRVRTADGRNNSSGSFANTVDGLRADIYRCITNAITDDEREFQRRRAHEEAQRAEAIRQQEIAAAEYLLVHLSFNWADEIEFDGWAALTQDEWVELKRTISKLKYPYEHYVGSNEEVTWYTETELLNKYRPVPINQAQYQVLIELFQGKSGEWLDFEDEDDDDE